MGFVDAEWSSGEVGLGFEMKMKKIAERNKIEIQIVGLVFWTFRV